MKIILKRATFALAAIYLLGVAAIAGWFSHQWQSIDAAKVSFEQTRLLPFYYHYYTSEARALTSAVSIAAMFAPIGVLAWVWGWSRFTAAALAVFLALIIETSRLFFATTHADPTNLLIAAFAAWATASLVARLFSSTAAAPATNDVITDQTGPPITAIATASPSLISRKHITLLLATGFSAYWLANFPVQPLWLATVFVACAVAAWLKPIFIVALIPAALPVFDLAPWSGRYFLDEFDILLLVTLVVGYARSSPAPSSAISSRLLNLTLGLLLVSFAISTARALIPLPALDANSFTSYFSSFNALRIGKGLVWAILFIGLYRRLAARTPAAFQWLAWGTTLGLAATVIITVREKALFGGLLNFASDYRATGPFSAIHIGGAFIEGYLAAAVPFLIFLTVRTQSWFQRIAGSALLLATTYALMVTVSRNGFAAYAVACIVAMLATFIGGGSKIRRAGVIAVLAGTTLAVAVPIFKG
ncbi:MAG: hypothetical protein Q8J78_07550, partial [Moraxellaceae bacterium]|nr:hypothetical protein [Moraxellaceae bacterium]